MILKTWGCLEIVHPITTLTLYQWLREIRIIDQLILGAGNVGYLACLIGCLRDSA